MSFDPQNPCTPANIIDITIQYKWQSGVNVPTASIRVDFGTPQRDQLITVPEMLTYIGYLQIKAALLGKSVVAIQYTNFKTVITIGDPPPFDFNKVITFQKDGVNFGAPENLIASYNTTLDNPHQVTSNFNIAMVTFTLPCLTGGQKSFLEEYTPSTIQPFLATNDTVNWTVQYCIFTLDNVLLNINFVSTAFIKITVDGQLQNSLILYGTGANPDTANGVLLAAPNWYVLPDTDFFFDGDILGGFNWVQKVSGTPVENKINQSIQQADIAVMGGVNEINLTHSVIEVIIDGVSFPDAAFVGCGLAEFVAVANPTVNYAIQKIRDAVYYYCSGKNSTNGNIYLKRGGIIIQSDTFTADGDVHTVTVNPANKDYDQIVIDVTSVGIALSARVANVEAGICAIAPITLYKSTPAPIITGNTLYDDAGLTIPHAGSLFVTDVTTGNTFHINNVTGVVGAAAATVCVPPIAKNIFVVNNSGVPIVVTTNPGGTQAFAPAMNGNVNITAEGIFQNDSLTTRTFTFYQSAPFIPANLTAGQVPNPEVLVNGGGNFVLPADISNHNYVVVT